MTTLLALLAIVATVAAALVLEAPSSRAIENNVVSAPDTVGTVGSHASLVLDVDGFPAVSYRDETNGDLKLLRCDDPACSGVGESIVVADSEGDVGASTSLALDGEGRPVVSYQDLTNGTLKLLHCGNRECTEGNSIVVVDTIGPGIGATSLELDAEGNPVVSYHDLTNDDLKLVHCGDPDCAGENSIVVVDSGAFTGSYSSLVLDGEGRPVISYRDGQADDLKVVRCGDANCASGNSIASPDAEGNVGAYTSIVLNSNGFPVVSHQDAAFGPSRLLRCGNADCTAGNTIGYPGASRGLYSSLALGEDERPYVAYHRQRDTMLVLGHCGDPGCVESTVSIPLQPMGLILLPGSHVSLALAAGDLPVIAYYDGANGDLGIFRCGDPDCAGKIPTPTPPMGLVGDASCDGIVTSVDATIALQMDAGLVAPASCQQGAEVNGDGIFNSLDATLILQFVAGLIASLPP